MRELEVKCVATTICVNLEFTCDAVVLQLTVNWHEQPLIDPPGRRSHWPLPRQRKSIRHTTVPAHGPRFGRAVIDSALSPEMRSARALQAARSARARSRLTRRSVGMLLGDVLLRPFAAWLL